MCVCYSEYFKYFILRNYFKNCQQKILFYNFLFIISEIISFFKYIFTLVYDYYHT